MYFSNDYDWGINPCVEISLRPCQFCNIVDINASNVQSQEDLNERVRAATTIATIQAAYTNFHYLRPIWKETTERDALLGIGMTGIGSGALDSLDLVQAAKVAKKVNKRVALKIGINKAARLTTIKPSGTSSLVLSCSSGIHAWHAPYYIRRVRVGKEEKIYEYFMENFPALVEDDLFAETQAVLSFPIKAPEHAVFRDEPVENFLQRVRRFSIDWVQQGHRDGANTHNVSATVSVKPDEWKLVGDWLWENRNQFNGLSVLPFDGGTYKQAPFEDCSRETWAEMTEQFQGFDISQIKEAQDYTNPLAEGACTGDKCEYVPKSRRKKLE